MVVVKKGEAGRVRTGLKGYAGITFLRKMALSDSFAMGYLGSPVATRQRLLTIPKRLSI